MSDIFETNGIQNLQYLRHTNVSKLHVHAGMNMLLDRMSWSTAILWAWSHSILRTDRKIYKQDPFTLQ